MHWRGYIVPSALLLATACQAPLDTRERALSEALSFHASFDWGYGADFTRGDPELHTAWSASLERRAPGMHRADARCVAGGRFGRALRFGDKEAREVLYYEAADNVAYAEHGWSGSLSLWIAVDPDAELGPGSSDPVTLSDSSWDDGAFWLDFDRDSPRAFRAGAFPEFATWHPTGDPRDPVDEAAYPRITASSDPFRGGGWVHAVLTWRGVNVPGEEAVVRLYLDGEPAGTLRRELEFVWSLDHAVIMLGKGFNGRIDDLALFDRELDPSEVAALHALPAGVCGLHR